MSCNLALPLSISYARLRRGAHTAAHGAAVMLMALALAACGPSADKAGGGAGGPPKGGGPGGAGGAPPPMAVTVRSVMQQTVPVLIDAVGQAEGSKEVEVRARVSGLLESQRYAEGERVKAGQTMFTIERAPFEIALAQAKAGLAQQQSLLDQAQREAKRLQPLAAMQAISQREADDAQSSSRNAEAGLSVARARVREAELNLSYTTAKAPIAGTAGRAEKSIGSLVGPTDGLLARIFQSDPIWVRFAFNDSELTQLRKQMANRSAGANNAKDGTPVRLLGADGKALGVTGKLNFTGSTVDPKLGTVQLRAVFPNPDLQFLPGQFVKAQVQAGEQKGWLVPQAAVSTNEQGKAVWVVRDGKAMPNPVEVGGWFGGDWIVLKGLQDGDQVVTDNLMKLRPGAPVQPKAAGPAGAPASGASGTASAAAPGASR
ncbi:MAG: efflux RND transporter periplasmic adaptor subunit [Rubrivivax sp.]